MASLWFTWTFDARTAGMGAFQHDTHPANGMSSTHLVPPESAVSTPVTPPEDPVTEADPTGAGALDVGPTLSTQDSVMTSTGPDPRHVHPDPSTHREVTGPTVRDRRKADPAVAYLDLTDPVTDRSSSRGDRRYVTKAQGQRPLSSSDDEDAVILKEAVTFLALLRHNEEALTERTRRLVKRDRRLAGRVLCREVGGWTPLHACTLRGARKLVKLALKSGVSPDLPMGSPQDGVAGHCTPLHLAAYRGDLSLLQLLLQAGACVSPRDAKGRTPLFYAAHNGNTLAARKLIKHGADLSDLSEQHRELYREHIERRPRLCVPVNTV